MQTLVKIAFLGSLLLLLAGCFGGSRYTGDWRAVGTNRQKMIITHVQGTKFSVVMTGIGGRPREMTGLLIPSGALEIGNTADANFQYLVADKDNDHLYLLQATDMRVINSHMEGGQVSRTLVKGLMHVEFARVKRDG